jgi:hypothetical protein
MLVMAVGGRGGGCKIATYSYCGKDILKLVDECNKRRVIHVDAIEALLADCMRRDRLAEIGTGTWTYAFGDGLVAMAGGAM